jgi:hypothetical protein
LRGAGAMLSKRNGLNPEIHNSFQLPNIQVRRATAVPYRGELTP